MKIIYSIVGWYGLVAVVTAYILTTFSFLSVDHPLIPVLNFTGAAGVAIVSFRKNAYEPAVMNVIWAGIGLVALAKIFL